MKIRRLCKVLLVLPFVATVAPAQQLLTNPNLDSDLGGWFIFGLDNGGSVSWSDFDADGLKDSGSAFVINRHDLPLCTGIGQSEMPVLPETEYLIGVSAWIPGDQPSPGHVTLQFQYRTAGCTQFMGVIQSIDWIQATGEWVTGQARHLSPPGADCVEFAVQVCKEQDLGDFMAYVDNPFVLGPEIFLDGFETGDLSAWVLPGP